jgi:hypothetical protein
MLSLWRLAINKARRPQRVPKAHHWRTPFEPVIPAFITVLNPQKDCSSIADTNWSSAE